MMDKICAWVQTFKRHTSSFVSRQRLSNERRNRYKYTKRRNIILDHARDEEIPTFDYATENPLSRVYVWGMAAFGALGVPKLLRPKIKRQFSLTTMHRPIRCGSAEMAGITDVACGYGYTIFATKNKSNKLLVTGLNRDGQIGYHSRGGKPLEVLIQPTGLHIPNFSGRVSRVACGRAHSLILGDDGSVFSLGHNSFGQCGRRIIAQENYFENRVVHLVHHDLWKTRGGQIIDIACGQDHSLFLSKSGQLFSCGWGADGQTGLGHYDNQDQPELIKGCLEGQKITKVSSSGDSNLALNDKGEVFGWGNSEYGQFALCASRDEQQINQPRHIPLPGIGRINDIAAGATVCMVLNECGHVFVWGFGILGKGPNLEESVFPTQIPPSLFGDSSVTSVVANVCSQAAINSKGDLFTWGKNRGCILGLGNEKDQFFPLRVAVSINVKKISMGIDHAVILGQPCT